VLLYLALGSRESYDSWLSFLRDVTARGLDEPLLVVSDKNKGLKKAVREVFPHRLQATMSGAQDEKYSLQSAQEDAEGDQGIGAGDILCLEL